MPALPVVTYPSLDSGHGCLPPHPGQAGQHSPNVRAGGKFVHVNGNVWSPHTCGAESDQGILTASSITVRVNGQPIARILDGFAGCSSILANGVATVFAGD